MVGYRLALSRVDVVTFFQPVSKADSVHCQIS